MSTLHGTDSDSDSENTKEQFSPEESEDEHLAFKPDDSLLQESAATRAKGILPGTLEDPNPTGQVPGDLKWPSIDDYKTYLACRFQAEISSAVQSAVHSYARSLEAADTMDPALLPAVMHEVHGLSVARADPKLSCQEAPSKSNLAGYPKVGSAGARKMSKTPPVSKGLLGRSFLNDTVDLESASDTSLLPNSSPLPEGLNPESPNGDVVYMAPPESMESKIRPYFKPAYIQYCTFKSKKDGVVRISYYCSGVFVCGDSSNCRFLARPLQPEKKCFDARPKAPSFCCRRHPNSELQWIRCTGGGLVPRESAQQPMVLHFLVEGVIYSAGFKGRIDVHFTSAFDGIQRRWVPVLVSFIFGRTTKHYKAHFDLLLRSYEVQSWEAFEEVFHGVSVDWSEAVGQAFLASLREFAANEHNNDELEEHDKIHSFVRKCRVHFLRSMTRVVKNGHVVGAGKSLDFTKRVMSLISDEISFETFAGQVRALVNDFPNAKNWMLWYLHDDRARSFFPACQDFTEADRRRFDSLRKDTNAQENVGKQFQFLFGAKQSLHEAILNLWNLVTRFETDRNSCLNGNATSYGMFPRANGAASKKRRYKNDGRSPDTTEDLGIAPVGRKKRKTGPATNSCILEDQHPPSETGDQSVLHSPFAPSESVVTDGTITQWRGLEWGGDGFTMTCPLDSVMMLRFVPYFAKLHRREVKELQDENGWLSRSFDLLRKGQRMQARRIWAKEMCGKYPWQDGEPTNMHGNLDNLYERSGRPVHPLHEFQEIHITRKLLCQAEKPCTRETSYKERDPDSDSDVEDTDHESWRPAPKRCRRPVILLGDTLSVEEGLNELLNPKEERKCGLSRVGERDLCAGPSLMMSKVTKWPHTLVFDTGSDIRRLAELPLDFTFHDEDDGTNTRKFVLRGAVLVGFGHFTSVIRAPRAWMHYDGCDPIKFHFYPLTRAGAEEAMRGRHLAKAEYEVMDADDATFTPADLSLDWGRVFEAANSYPDLHDIDSEVSEAAVDHSASWVNRTTENLEQLHAEIRGSFEKRRTRRRFSPGAPQPRTQDSRYVKTGFSFRDYTPTKGQRPTCRSCQSEIAYSDNCLRYKFTRGGHKYPTVLQYHCSERCIRTLPASQLRELKDTNWSDCPTVSGLLEQMEAYPSP